MAGIPGFGKWKQEYQEFKTSLGYMGLCLKKDKVEVLFTQEKQAPTVYRD